MVIVAFLCFLTISSAFDSSEIRMLEEEYDKRNPLRYMDEIIGESEKRARLDNPLIRFGKRSAYGMEREIRNAMQMDPLIRFGKRASYNGAPLIRFGKRAPYDGAPLIRFGKRPDTAPLIRFGKRASPSSMLSAPHIRFGKRDFNDEAYSRQVSLIKSILYLLFFENVKVGKLSQDAHPLTFCAICNLASPIPCWECPDIDDLPLCDLVNEFEDYSDSSLNLSDHLNSDYNDFKEQCINGQGKYSFGEVTANLNISIGECVKCNLVVKLIQFIQDETLTPGLVKTLEGICPLIKNCTNELVEALIQGLRDSLVYFYHLIGVDLLHCPEYQDFYDSCIQPPTSE
uniref:Uncharacterized protein n=1 Tax=Panagrolaimus sp. ES5 TaxID=591445 RepID=A0AC34F9D3_9BILA